MVKPSASKLGLTKRSKRVQLSYWFTKSLVVDGQLHLRRVSAGKNPAVVLTKQLSASNMHKLLPKLGVRTRAADSRDLLTMLSLELLASSREDRCSFFIGMMAEQPVAAQRLASRVDSRLLPGNSLHHTSQEVAPILQSSQTTFSFLEALLVIMKLYWFVVCVYSSLASTRTSLRRALGTPSSCPSVALVSLLSTSLQRSLMRTNPRNGSRQPMSAVSFCMEWGASAYHDSSLHSESQLCSNYTVSLALRTFASTWSAAKQRRWLQFHRTSLLHSCLRMKLTPYHQLC